MAAKWTISEEELLELTGYQSRGFLESWLIEQGIPYFRSCKGRIWTTLGLLESVKLPKNPGQQSQNEQVTF